MTGIASLISDLKYDGIRRWRRSKNRLRGGRVVAAAPSWPALPPPWALPWDGVADSGNKAEGRGFGPVRFVCLAHAERHLPPKLVPGAVAGAGIHVSASLRPLEKAEEEALGLSGMQNNDASVVFGSHGLACREC